MFRIDKFRSGLIVLLMGTIVFYFGLRRIWLSDILTLASSIQDDSFYYLLPGWFVSRVGFFSFDGATKTYGFQPLYEILISLLGMGASDVGQLLRSALTLNLILHVLTGGVIYIIARSISASFLAKGFQNFCGILAATFWYVNMPLYLSQLTGKENSLASLLLSIVLLSYFRAKLNNFSSNRWVIAFGFFTGLLAITRIHPSAIFIISLLWVSIIWINISTKKPEILTLAWSFIALIAPILAWGLYAESEFNQFMPTSGLVKMGNNRAAIFSNILNPIFWHEAFDYLANSVQFSLGLDSNFHFPQPESQSLQNHHFTFEWPDNLIRSTIFILSFLGAMYGVTLTRGRILLPIPCLVIASLLGHLLTFTLLKHRGEMYYYIWYIFDLPVVISLSLGLGIGCLAQLFQCLSVSPLSEKTPEFIFTYNSEMPSNRQTGLVAGCLLSIVIVFISAKQFKPFEKFSPNPADWQNVMIQAGLKVKNNPKLDPEAKVVAWSSGALGFLMPGRVINLDGLANDEVLKARRMGKSEADVILSLGKAYFVDLHPNFLGDKRLSSHLIDKVPFPAMGDYYIYEISTSSQ